MAKQTEVVSPNNKSIRSRSTKIDWFAVRKDYVANPTLSYDDIAKKYLVHINSVKKHGASDGWAAARRRVQELGIEKAEVAAISELQEVNARHTTQYRNMQAIATVQLRIAYDQIKKAIKQAEIEGKELDIYASGMISQHRLKFLFDSLKTAMDGERITLGLPITVTKTEMTGVGGGPLFEQVDTNGLRDLLQDTLSALADE